MDLDELRRIFARQSQAGGAGGFIANDEVESSKALLLRLRAAVLGQGVGCGHELCGIGGCGISQIVGADVFRVPADLGIRREIHMHLVGQTDRYRYLPIVIAAQLWKTETLRYRQPGAVQGSSCGKPGKSLRERVDTCLGQVPTLSPWFSTLCDPQAPAVAGSSYGVTTKFFMVFRLKRHRSFAARLRSRACNA